MDRVRKTGLTDAQIDRAVAEAKAAAKQGAPK